MKLSDEQLARIRSGAADHLERYVATGGADGYLYKGVPILVLTATGRRTGGAENHAADLRP